MAVGTTAAIIGGAALVGGAAGAMGNKSSQTQSSYLDAGKATGAENAGQSGMLNSFNQLQGFVNAGPGQQDITNAYQSQTGLAGMYDQYSKGGYVPTAGDISQANGLAQSLFQSQRTGLQQSQVDQTTAANRSAAAMGRATNDPILQAKLGTEFMRQNSMLNANQGGFAAQYAQQMPQNRLQYAAQSAGILGGLATQAMANRQALASMGEGIMNNERNWRAQTGTHYGTQTQQSGGGVGGFLTGALGGAGAGMSMAGGMPGGFGGGGPAASNTNPFSFMTGQSTTPVSGTGQMIGFGSK